MIIKKFVLSPFQQNTRIVSCENSGKAICIDPGARSPELVNYIKSNELELTAIAITHGHLDHVGGTDSLHAEFPNAEILIHEDDAELYYGLPLQPLALGMPESQLASLGLIYADPPKITRFWKDGEEFEVGELSFEVRHCPGHTLGHVVLVEKQQKKVFVGDCLFKGSIGRTDLPGGSYSQLIESITTKILSLDDDFRVYSGHGDETTVRHERVSNPFLNGT